MGQNTQTRWGCHITAAGLSSQRKKATSSQNCGFTFHQSQPFHYNLSRCDALHQDDEQSECSALSSLYLIFDLSLIQFNLGATPCIAKKNNPNARPSCRSICCLLAPPQHVLSFSKFLSLKFKFFKCFL